MTTSKKRLPLNICVFKIFAEEVYQVQFHCLMFVVLKKMRLEEGLIPLDKILKFSLSGNDMLNSSVKQLPKWISMCVISMRYHYWHRESMSSMLREILASSLTASCRCQHRF